MPAVRRKRSTLERCTSLQSQSTNQLTEIVEGSTPIGDGNKLRNSCMELSNAACKAPTAPAANGPSTVLPPDNKMHYEEISPLSYREMKMRVARLIMISSKNRFVVHGW